MGIVNADVNEILQAWNNIRTAITSIGTTKSTISKKYQQLNGVWKDKKYKELGEVVHDCNNALNSILKTLMQGEKYLSLLAKSLKEYEETEFGAAGVERSSNSFVESVQNNARVLQKSDKEKMQDFKIGLAAINERIENYADSLESRGLPRGATMDAVLNHRRTLEQAELLRNINGDFSNPVSPLTPESMDAIVANCQNRGLVNYNPPTSSPRALSATQYGFQAQIINGQELRVYDDPVGTNSLLIQQQGHQQGNSQYDMEGTCGLCQCANLLTMSGVQGSTEDSIISAAMHSSDDVLVMMEMFSPYSEERGGTTVQNRQEILSRCGLPTYSMPMSANREENTQRLSEAIRTGHGVIVSVDVAHLWRNGQSGGHAISLISVSEDGNTFIYNDTGRGTMGTISATDLGYALTGRPANVTTNIIR